MAERHVKAYVTWRLLHLRREHPRTFRNGAYVALDVLGTRAENIVAFARDDIVTVVPRLVRRILEREDGTLALSFTDEKIRLPSRGPRIFEERFTGRHIEARTDESGAYVRPAGILREFPVAVLVPL